MFLISRISEADSLIGIRPPRRKFRVGLDSILILIVGSAFLFAFITQQQSAAKSYEICELRAVDGDAEHLARDLLSDKVLDVALDHPTPIFNKSQFIDSLGKKRVVSEIVPRSESRYPPTPYRMDRRFTGLEDPRSEFRDKLRIKVNPDTHMLTLRIEFCDSPCGCFSVQTLAAVAQAAEEELGSQRVAIGTSITTHFEPPANPLYCVAFGSSLILFTAVSLRWPKNS